MSELKPKGRTKSVAPEKIERLERRLEKSTKVHHDLFCLKEAATRKNVSYSDIPNWVNVNHKHFYHTTDSSGKSQINSVPTAGHFHKVEVTHDDDGEIIGVSCGPPMVMHKGAPTPYRNDSHTHEIEYIASEIVERRVTNADAIAVMNISRKEETEAQKGVAGMLG